MLQLQHGPGLDVQYPSCERQRFLTSKFDLQMGPPGRKATGL
jgi:hypothetical protein